MQHTQTKNFIIKVIAKSLSSLFCYVIFYSIIIIHYFFRFEKFPIKQETHFVLQCFLVRGKFPKAPFVTLLFTLIFAYSCNFLSLLVTWTSQKVTWTFSASRNCYINTYMNFPKSYIASNMTVTSLCSLCYIKLRW